MVLVIGDRQAGPQKHDGEALGITLSGSAALYNLSEVNFLPFFTDRTAGAAHRRSESAPGCDGAAASIAKGSPLPSTFLTNFQIFILFLYVSGPSDLNE